MSHSISPLFPGWARKAVRNSINEMPFLLGQVRGFLGRGPERGGKVCIMGVLRSTQGLGEGARLFSKALDLGNIERSSWDVSNRYGVNQAIPFNLVDPTGSTTLIAHLNPLEYIHALGVAPSPRPKRGLRIGYWAWETTVIPTAWKRAFASVDEIWCPSNFVRDAFLTAVGSSKPVRLVPHPLFAAPIGSSRKAAFDFCDDKVTVLTALDLNSSLARKNTLASLRAFQNSRQGVRGNAEFVIKVSGTSSNGPTLELLARAVEAVPGARLLETTLDRASMINLIASADIVISLHRSEGYGLLLAEAMRSGVAVIATGWSGNMDFCDEESIASVPYKLIDVQDNQGIYSGGSWAEPDIDTASQMLEHLILNASARSAQAQAGQIHYITKNQLTQWHDEVRRYLSS